MKPRAEFEQSIIRVVFVSLLLVALLCWRSNIDQSSIHLCIAYWCVAILTHMSIIYSPKPSKFRMWVCMLMDISATSYEFVLSGEYGGVLVGIYLWLIIGYGLRYGTFMLKSTYLASILGFCIALNFNAYWIHHMNLVYGVLITMLLIPIHTHRLLKQLNLATEKAEAANKAKSQFLSHISHEIRTPLNGIIGACSLIDITKLDGKQKQYTTIMKTSSELIVELVNNVLDLSKIENGKMSVQNIHFKMNELINKTIGLFETQAKQKNLNLIYDLDENLPDQFEGDFLHIKQILINLIGNAIKFTQTGSIKLRVSKIEETTGKVKCRFEVIDTGIGISETALPNIFDSFTQADDSIKYKFGGTGLGTAISKELVALMGGKIGVESKEGIGSTFWFELELKEVVQENAITIENQESGFIDNVVSLSNHVVKSRKHKSRILVADDSFTNQIIIKEILVNAGYLVTTASNGEDALDILEEHEFDLMLLDKNMPDRDGIEVMKVHYALNAHKPKIPAVLLTADTTLNHEELMEQGVSAYITKPIDVEMLLSTIDKILSSNNKENHKKGVVVSYNEKNKPDFKQGFVDFSSLDALSRINPGNLNFVRDLSNQLFKEIDAILLTINSNLIGNNYFAIKDCAHTLAGNAGNLGLVKLSDIAIQLEAVAKQEDHSKVRLLIERMHKIYDGSKTELLSYQSRFPLSSSN
jgi:two-component system sensor histidine kinase RpfC